MISLNQDVLINEILNKLSIPDLLHFFETNKELKDKYLPYFQEEIDDYQEYLQYRKSVIIPHLIKRFPRNESTVSFRIGAGRNFLGISNRLANFMGIQHMPSFNELKIYTFNLLLLWWELYFSNIFDHSLTNLEIFTLPDDVAQLIQKPIGTSMNLISLIFRLIDLYTTELNFKPNEYEMIMLIQEADELDNTARFMNREFEEIQ